MDVDSNHQISAAAGDRGRHIEIIRPVRSPFDILIVGFKSLVRSASLLRSMIATRLKTRYRYSILGWCWALLQPLTLVALYGILFSRLANYGTERLPYALFLFPGLMLWAFCSTSITTAAAGTLNHQRLMATVYFPREIIPFSYVAASLVDLAIAFLILLIMMFLYSIPVSWTALLCFPILIIFVVLVTAISLFISCLQVRFRDISVALPLLLQVLMFATPIVYPASAVPSNISDIYWLNPFAILVESFRQAMVGGMAPGFGELAYCAILAIISFAISYLMFKLVEPTIVDEI